MFRFFCKDGKSGSKTGADNSARPEKKVEKMCVRPRCARRNVGLVGECQATESKLHLGIASDALCPPEVPPCLTLRLELRCFDDATLNGDSLTAVPLLYLSFVFGGTVPAATLEQAMFK